MTLQALLGMELPIIQAPMAGVQGSALALAVSESGALGSLPCGMLTADALRSEMALIRSRTDRPVNVNFFCHESPVPDVGREQAWRNLLAPYYQEYGIEYRTGGASRVPFNSEMAAVLEEFSPAVVSFHFGLPEPVLLARVKRWGAKVLGCATTVEEARWLEVHGADAVIAQGAEAGGHRGMFLTEDISTQMGTLALVRQVVQSVSLPVIGAGGIADAEGVRAVMALGAAGVQVGTAYLLCPEATTSAVHRAALQDEGAGHTALTNLFSGRPARGIVNRLMRELGPINGQVPPFPLASAGLAPLREQAERSGSGDFSPLWAGQNTRGCREIPAAELTRQLAAGLM